MNPTNWRTTMHGVVIGLLMLASIWAPAEYQPLITKTSMAFVAMGLFTSADAANMGFQSTPQKKGDTQGTV